MSREKNLSISFIERYMKTFQVEKKPKGMLVSDPDFEYYRKRANLYFEYELRLENEKNYTQRNLMIYKRNAIIEDFKELLRISQTAIE